MAVGQPAVDFFDAIHREHFAGRLAREFVRTMTCANCDGEGIDAGLSDKSFGLVWIREQLVMRQLAFAAVALFFFALARFERAETAELALDRNAARMSQFANFARHSY